MTEIDRAIADVIAWLKATPGIVFAIASIVLGLLYWHNRRRAE